MKVLTENHLITIYFFSGMIASSTVSTIKSSKISFCVTLRRYSQNIVHLLLLFHNSNTSNTYYYISVQILWYFSECQKNPTKSTAKMFKWRMYTFSLAAMVTANRCSTRPSFGFSGFELWFSKTNVVYQRKSTIKTSRKTY